ncbi:Crp/Fnr family transcriptional regulator [Alteribacter natronophilus]|uniref:Crp/Fnr family transcriptional regulator n=1 Tax=Alteribacter natronophilus TaxID=2583810 RepID=UPI001486076E|nr:Crp/Fnr family transcriptional regulator [Alteribacter natronophilus]
MLSQDDQSFFSQNFQSPWFHNDVNDWLDIFEKCPQISYRKNSVIYHQGEVNQYIYCIVEGRVRASLLDTDGQEKSIIILNKGSIFGESSAIEQIEAIVTTTTNTDSKISYIHRDQFLKTILNNTNLSKKLIFNLTSKLTSLKNHISEITFMNANERVITYLYKLSQQYGLETKVGRKVTIKFTHQEMADLSGTSRVTVSNIMRSLDKTGTITKINGYYYIKNISELLEWKKSNK